MLALAILVSLSIVAAPAVAQPCQPLCQDDPLPGSTVASGLVALALTGLVLVIAGIVRREHG